jgi:hypothetical protein
MSTSQLTRLLAALAGAALLASAAPAIARASYGWPLKPFDQPHPVRGSFGDPRSIFTGTPSLATVLHGSCQCSFHQGVDISGENGTAVYPVADGVVTRISTAKAEERIEVSSGANTFEYWHISVAVRAGQRVEAGRTILGRILRPAGHVHLTERRNGRVVNPLQPGHLSPYRDTTSPQVGAIAFRTPNGTALLPNYVHGSFDVVVEVTDSPALAVPGIWNGMPVTPARIAWRITRWNGRPTGIAGVAWDVRSTVPPDSAFWSVYARGTFQNMSVIGHHYSWLQPGSFLFRLAPSGFRAGRLKSGVYAVVVTATDIAGNSDTRSARFSIANGSAI